MLITTMFDDDYYLTFRMIFGAVDIFGDKYSNFALGALIGIPGNMFFALIIE